MNFVIKTAIGNLKITGSAKFNSLKSFKEATSISLKFLLVFTNICFFIYIDSLKLFERFRKSLYDVIFARLNA